MTNHKTEILKFEEFEQEMLEQLSNDDFARDYLNDALEEQDIEMFLLGLNDIAKAKGMKLVAEKTGINREHLYKMLSANGNPSFMNVLKLTAEFGLKLSVNYIVSQSMPKAYSNICEAEVTSTNVKDFPVAKKPASSRDFRQYENSSRFVMSGLRSNRDAIDIIEENDIANQELALAA